MSDELASTYHPWEAGGDPFASTRDAETLPTQTYRYPLSGASDILRKVSESENQKDALKKLDIADDASHINAESDLVLQHEIGRGGVGIVSSAEQVSLNRDIAIKSLRADRDSTSARSQLIYEARIQARLNHPGIPPVHIIGADSRGNPVLGMQLVQGECWTDTLIRDGQQLDSGLETPLLQHLQLLSRICEAIAFAHDQGVIHRDIKPGNVMLGKFGEVYLVDWGLAAELDENGKFAPPGFTGTPAYAAPEMIHRGALLDIRTDIYLLGSTLYEIITGQPPHSGDTIKEVFERIDLHEELKFPSWIPTELADICRRTLEADPDDRFQTVHSLLTEIRLYMERHQSIGMLDRVRDHVARLDEMVEANVDHDRIEDLGQICRAMLEALRVQLPDLEEINQLHQHCSVVMINRMIESKNIGAARIMLESIPPSPETEALRERVAALAGRMLAKPTHIATNVQLMLTEELVQAKQEIAELKARLKES